jgi:hypothetical protein
MIDRRACNRVGESNSRPALSLAIDPDGLRGLISEIVEQTVRHLDEVKATLPDRLGYSEAEAATLLGLESHVLRDERRRGRVRAFVVAGRRVRYSRDDLIAYLTRRQWTEAMSMKSCENVRNGVHVS